MTPRNLLVAIVAVAVVAAALTFLLYEPSIAIAQTDPPPRAEPAAPPPVAAVTSDAPVAPTLSKPVAADAQRTEAAPTATTAPGPLARIVGRCVDAAGAPLAGCTIHVHGWGANSQRVEAWQAEHGEPSWQDPEDIVTGDDGRFAFAFWPPPPFQFAIDVKKDGCGSLNARWSQLDEGQTKDVGDVAVTPGVKVRGRVSDQQANPLQQTYLMISRVERGNDENVVPAWGTQVRTADDGTFETRDWLVPGAYGLRLNDREIASDKTVELVAERPYEELQVVVADIDAAKSIRGRVIDEAGAPVAGLEVQAAGSARASTHSKDDGTFVLVARQPPREGPTFVVAASLQYEPLEPRTQTTWGATDLELRVKRTAQLVLRVTDAELQPVTNYSVRLLIADPNMRMPNSTDPRSTGNHPDGVATVPGIRPGKWMLLIEFPAQSGFEPISHSLDATASLPERLDLIARHRVERKLRVVSNDGEPVAGAPVWLCELFGKRLDEQLGLMPPSMWKTNIGHLPAKLLLAGNTDADGRLTLRGPGDRPLGLLIGGNRVCEPWRDEVQLGVEGELLVRVDRGATIAGSCAPPEGLAALRRLADITEGEGFGDEYRPKLVLKRADGLAFPDPLLRYIDTTATALGDNGTFSLTGVPAGHWQVDLIAWFSLGTNGRTTRDIAIAEVTLVSGRTTELVLDLNKVIPGTLEARVLHNGEPVKGGWLSHDGGGISLRLDENGHCSSTMLPGTFAMTLEEHDLPSPNQVTIYSGQTTEVELQFFSGQAKLQLLDPDGAALASTAVYLRGRRMALGTTDEQGHLQVTLAPGTHTLAVLPKRLATREEQQRIWQEARARGDQDPLGTLLLPIGEVTLQANDDREVELRMPESWRQ